MYTDLFSLYHQNTQATGFWIRKKNWVNYVAQVLKISHYPEGHVITDHDNHQVIAMIMDKRDNEIKDIVELSEPSSPNFESLQERFIPNTVLPQSFIDYITNSE